MSPGEVADQRGLNIVIIAHSRPPFSMYQHGDEITAVSFSSDPTHSIFRKVEDYKVVGLRLWCDKQTTTSLFIDKCRAACNRKVKKNSRISDEFYHHHGTHFSQRRQATVVQLRNLTAVPLTTRNNHAGNPPPFPPHQTVSSGWSANGLSSG